MNFETRLRISSTRGRGSNCTAHEMACDDCIALIGKPAGVAPHAALYGERARVRSDGILNHFKCRICGTLWERFEANRYFKREPQVWTLRPVSNQSVWTNAKAKVASG
jgi:hypothetical protein